MTDYLFRLEVPADKRGFTVGEALDATSGAIHPKSTAEGPVMILSIDKAKLGREGRPTALDEADWQLLRVIWSEMEAPIFPMPIAQWRPYLEAFHSSPDRPNGWTLSALQRDPKFQSALMRAAALQDHLEILKREVNRGAIALRNPQSGHVSELGWLGDSDDWLLTRRAFKALCDLLAIEVVDAPHFVTSARPVSVPPELLALAPDARITYEENIGGQRGNGACSAGDYREQVQATIARQAEGYFTLDEAAQVLADSRPGLDPIGTVKRFRAAHSKGVLPIHQGGSRFPLEPGETIRNFLDLVQVSELDAWLRKSAGYGFPKPEGVAESAAADPTGRAHARDQASQEPATDRGRRVKRAALIADNLRRWPTIERDLKDAATNGLSEAAKDADATGWWWEGSAFAWARARAKVADAAPSLAGMHGTIHRMKG